MVLNLTALFQHYDFPKTRNPVQRTTQTRKHASAAVIERTNAKYRALMEGRGKVTSDWLAGQLLVHKCSVNSALKRMCKDGLVTREEVQTNHGRGVGKYRVMWEWVGE